MHNTLITRQERLNIQGAVIPSGVWLVLVAVVATFPVGVGAQSLRGSRASLDRQNEQAARHDFTFLDGPSQLNRFVRAGLLVPVRRTRHYALNDVSFPYTRPEVKLFIERLAQQYYRGCGEQLVVTSLTRPRSHQPRNASPRSVHPTGMALDLRRPSNRRCREWLESTTTSRCFHRPTSGTSHISHARHRSPRSPIRIRCSQRLLKRLKLPRPRRPLKLRCPRRSHKRREIRRPPRLRAMCGTRSRDETRCGESRGTTARRRYGSCAPTDSHRR